MLTVNTVRFIKRQVKIYYSDDYFTSLRSAYFFERHPQSIYLVNIIQLIFCGHMYDYS